jgi:hypothetical protein
MLQAPERYLLKDVEGMDFGYEVMLKYGTPICISRFRAQVSML